MRSLKFILLLLSIYSSCYLPINCDTSIEFYCESSGQIEVLVDSQRVDIIDLKSNNPIAIIEDTMVIQIYDTLKIQEKIEVIDIEVWIKLMETDGEVLENRGRYNYLGNDYSIDHSTSGLVLNSFRSNQVCPKYFELNRNE